jgi:hypothetical protein
MTSSTDDNCLISMADRRSIIAFMKLIHARTKAGEQVCISCYVKKTLDIFNKYMKENKDSV